MSGRSPSGTARRPHFPARNEAASAGHADVLADDHAAVNCRRQLDSSTGEACRIVWLAAAFLQVDLRFATM